ncbi:MAG TPA: metallophosphoesterase [Polyangia bacterium]|nr:metallophosphoesterase [Polyangia bacterium]
MLMVGCGGDRDEAADAGVAIADLRAANDAAGGDGATSDGAPPCATCVRDWSTAPAIVEVDGVGEIWALSDIHGDYDALTKLLAGAHVIAKVPAAPAQVTWNQGAAVLVVVGDAIDKGPDAPDVLALLIALRASAATAGGRVIVTMGNHEAEFLADPNNAFASKTGVEEGLDPELAAIGLTPTQTADGQDALGVFLRGLPLAARVDDWFFMHAGDTGGAGVTQLAGAIMSGVDAAWFGAPVVSDADSILEARLSATGPQWWDATSDPAALLGQWTAALGVGHLVMGHQPGAVGFADGTKRASDTMFAAYGGLVFLIDTGMSVGADDTGGALLHVQNAGAADETWESVLPDGTKKSL